MTTAQRRAGIPQGTTIVPTGGPTVSSLLHGKYAVELCS